jgi:hypothetical protein
MKNVMKKVPLSGVGLGLVLGLLVGLFWGSWMFWLGTGLAIGAILGSATARRSLLGSTNVRGELKP